MIRSILAVVAFASSLALVQTSAQTTVATDPVGFTTLTVAAKPANTRGFTLLSLNMTRPVAFQALVPSGGVSTSNGRTVLTFSENSFTANQFNGQYLEVANGTDSGRLSDITSTSTSSITLADDISASLTAGTSTIKIRPNWTFGTAFGTNNSAGLQGAGSASQADVIQLVDPASGVARSYFYSTSNNRWQEGFRDATNDEIPIDTGLRIERKQSSPVAFTLAGAVKLGRTGLFVQGGSVPQNSTIVPNPYPLASVALANSNLYTGNPATGVRGGGSASQADTVNVINPATGVYTTYFYSTANNRWQTGFQDASNATISEGASVIINRKSATANQFPSFIWYVPQPAMSL